MASLLLLLHTFPVLIIDVPLQLQLDIIYGSHSNVFLVRIYYAIVLCGGGWSCLEEMCFEMGVWVCVRACICASKGVCVWVQ